MKFGSPCLGKSAAVAKVCKQEVYTDLASRLDLILHHIFSGIDFWDQQNHFC